MGFEDEAEQSITRPYRQIDDRSKRTCELTSSIVPRGTSFHRWVELGFSPIAFDSAWFSCCCDVPGPAELGAIDPDTVQDDGQSPRQGDDRLFHPAVAFLSLMVMTFSFRRHYRLDLTAARACI